MSMQHLLTMERLVDSIMVFYDVEESDKNLLRVNLNFLRDDKLHSLQNEIAQLISNQSSSGKKYMIVKNIFDYGFSIYCDVNGNMNEKTTAEFNFQSKEVNSISFKGPLVPLHETISLLLINHFEEKTETEKVDYLKTKLRL